MSDAALRRLTERYKELAVRYAAVTGEQAPAMEATMERLTAAIQAMAEKLNTVRYGARTGRQVVSMGAVRIVVDTDDTVRATVDGLDADGGLVTTVDVVLGGREIHGRAAVQLQMAAREMAAPLLGVTPP